MEVDPAYSFFCSDLWAGQLFHVCRVHILGFLEALWRRDDFAWLKITIFVLEKKHIKCLDKNVQRQSVKYVQ